MQGWTAEEEFRVYGGFVKGYIRRNTPSCYGWLVESGPYGRSSSGTMETQAAARKACDEGALECFRASFETDRAELLYQVIHNFDNAHEIIRFVRDRNPVLAVSIMTHLVLEEDNYLPDAELLPTFFTLFDWFKTPTQLPDLSKETRQWWYTLSLLTRSASRCLDLSLSDNEFSVLYRIDDFRYVHTRDQERAMQRLHRAFRPAPRKS